MHLFSVGMEVLVDQAGRGKVLSVAEGMHQSPLGGDPEQTFLYTVQPANGREGDVWEDVPEHDLMPPPGEYIAAEITIADVAVRFISIPERGFVAAGSPVADEWCYLADSESLEELEAAVRVILEDETTRGIFVRCAALLGVVWSGEMLPLLQAQEQAGLKLAADAPDTATADPEELRKIRRAAAADAG